jgi:hypothetical protein
MLLEYTMHHKKAVYLIFTVFVLLVFVNGYIMREYFSTLYSLDFCDGCQGLPNIDLTDAFVMEQAVTTLMSVDVTKLKGCNDWKASVARNLNMFPGFHWDLRQNMIYRDHNGVKSKLESVLERLRNTSDYNEQDVLVQAIQNCVDEIECPRLDKVAQWIEVGLSEQNITDLHTINALFSSQHCNGIYAKDSYSRSLYDVADRIAYQLRRGMDDQNVALTLQLIVENANYIRSISQT